MAGRTPPEGRRFYKIGEAAALVGVKPHVLRYWEAEFPELRPLKTRGAHRMYGVRELEVACRIRDLVVTEGLTVAAARRRLRGPGAAEVAPGAAPPSAGPALEDRRTLLAVRHALADVLDALDAVPAPRPPRLVRVESVTPIPGHRPR